MHIDSPRPFPKNTHYANMLATAEKTRAFIASGGCAPPGTPPIKQELPKKKYVTARNSITQFKKKPVPLPEDNLKDTVTKSSGAGDAAV